MPTTTIYTLSLHDALPIYAVADLDHAADLLKVDLGFIARELSLDDFADLSGLDHSRPFSETATGTRADRKSTRLNSSHLGISYAVFCLKKKRQSHHQQSQR